MDNRIREAAENHHPAYNEKAWPAMEKLLDKHLPVEKKRRRRFLIWWLLPLLAGGSYLLFTQLQQNGKEPHTISSTQQAGVQPNQPSSSTVLDQSATPTDRDNGPLPSPDSPVKDNPNTTSINTPDPVKDNLNATSSNTSGPVKDNPNRTSTNITTPGTANPGATETGSSTGTPKPSYPADIRNQQGVTVNTKNPEVAIAVQNGTIGKKRRNTTLPTSEKKQVTLPVSGIIPDNKIQPADPATTIVNPTAEKKQDGANLITAVPVISETVNVIPEPVKTPDENQTVNKKPAGNTDSVMTLQKNTTASKAPRKKAKNSLFLAISAGPDLSFVSAERPGTTKLVTGLGLGYQYKNRFTIRTGFYTARKIYTAGPTSYNTPPEFNQYYPYLEKVDANCKVYEIPVTVSYYFGRKQTRNFFVAGGLSTLLMKEETYKYFYKYTPQGQTYTNQWTINNENKHFFSVLTLSGGYQRNFGKRVSLIAEPYLKLPLGGVGYGRVKLNSGGVLFTAGIKLF